MQTIAPLSSSAVDYLITFNARAVAITSAGFVYTSTNPAGAACAYWTQYDDALRLAKAAHASGDIVGTAKRLKIPLTEHATVLERVQARTQRLDEALQRRRTTVCCSISICCIAGADLAAQQTGQRFITYPNVQRRLRQAITETIANGGEINKSLVSRALEI